MREHLSDDEFHELLRLVQEAALQGYPNPERRNCPGSRILEEVAAAPAPFKHPAYEHIKRCSPCLKEMLDLRGERIRTRRAASLKWQKRAATIVAVSLFVAGICLVVLHNPSKKYSPGPVSNKSKTIQRIPTAQIPAVIPLDFRALAAQRGTEPPSQQQIWHIPSRLVALDITLPFGSDDGTYTIELRRNGVPQPLKSLLATAKIQDGDTHLTVASLDLSGVPPGQYGLFYRHGDATTWHRAKITVNKVQQ
jgi:hypothetical protein